MPALHAGKPADRPHVRPLDASVPNDHEDVPTEVQTALEEFVTFAGESADSSRGVDVAKFLAWCDARCLTQCAGTFLSRAADEASLEQLALRHRLAEARFELLLEHGAESLAAVVPRSGVAVHFNPHHVWTTRHSSSAAARDIDGDVLLCATRSGARVVAVAGVLSPMLRRLAAAGSRPLKSLTAAVPGWSREQVLSALRELARQGVIAVASAKCL